MTPQLKYEDEFRYDAYMATRLQSADVSFADLLKEKNITVKELANAMSMAPSAMYAYRRGRRLFDSMQLLFLSMYLNVEIEDIVVAQYVSVRQIK